MSVNSFSGQPAIPASYGTSAGKNAVINGGFDIWQRGTSVAVATNTQAYTADRWNVISAGLNQAVTISRQATSDTTNLPNIQYCARVQRNSGQTGTSPIYFGQSFETVNSIPFVGKTVTLSLYARAGANYSGGNLSVAIDTGTGTDQNILSGYTGGASPINSGATLTTAWQRFTFTGTISTTTTELGVRVNYTPTGTAGANDYFEITGVQLELGATATTFARNGSTYQAELAACQRYYWRNTAGASFQTFAIGQAVSGTRNVVNVQYPVPMRIAPAAVDYSTVATTNSSDANLTVTSLATVYMGVTSGLLWADVASGLTAGNASQLRANNSTSAYIAFSAEL